MLLEAFTRLLEPSCDVVGTASDGLEAIAEAPALHPDVVVLDVAMPNLNGIETAQRLNEQLPHAKIIYLTTSEDPQLAARALRLGASGYLLKKGAASELIKAIHGVLDGETHITPAIAGPALAAMNAPTGPELTTRQREVLQMLAEGRSLKEIGSALHITPRTVGHHKNELRRVLGASTDADLFRHAVRLGLLTP